jgi:hypothetical protein
VRPIVTAGSRRRCGVNFVGYCFASAVYFGLGHEIKYHKEYGKKLKSRPARQRTCEIKFRYTGLQEWTIQANEAMDFERIMAELDLLDES